MRIGFIFNRESWNIAYRAEGPAEALRRRGHEVVIVVRDHEAPIDLAPLHACDVVHIYRQADDRLRRSAEALQQRGVAITWDNDDDVRRMPSADQRRLGLNRRDLERAFQYQVKMARTADLVTTTSDALAEEFRKHGAARVARIENHLFESQYARSRTDRRRVVIGWVAGTEHGADDRALGMAQTLDRVLARHPKAHVDTVGIALDLPPARYQRQLVIPLAQLSRHISAYDIAIAPIADIPMSYTRSNVKVKEYAAAGVPWLASARGPYLGLGPEQGGMLVEDDGWEQALDTLITSRLTRYRLGRRAASWAKTQLVDRHVDQWLAAFEDAVAARRQARVQAPPPGARRAVR